MPITVHWKVHNEFETKSYKGQIQKAGSNLCQLFSLSLARWTAMHLFSFSNFVWTRIKTGSPWWEFECPSLFLCTDSSRIPNQILTGPHAWKMSGTHAHPQTPTQHSLPRQCNLLIFYENGYMYIPCTIDDKSIFIIETAQTFIIKAIPAHSLWIIQQKKWWQEYGSVLTMNWLVKDGAAVLVADKAAYLPQLQTVRSVTRVMQLQHRSSTLSDLVKSRNYFLPWTSRYLTGI